MNFLILRHENYFNLKIECSICIKVKALNLDLTFTTGAN